MKKRKLLFLLPIAAMALGACGKKNDSNNSGSEESGEQEHHEDGEVTLASPHKEGYFYSKRFDGKELLIDEEGIFFDRTNYGKVKNGINITVYDKITGEVADAVGITPFGIER